MRSDSALCMAGDPSRVPLFSLRADAYRALSRLSIQAACKLVRSSGGLRTAPVKTPCG